MAATRLPMGLLQGSSKLTSGSPSGICASGDRLWGLGAHGGSLTRGLPLIASLLEGRGLLNASSSPVDELVFPAR